MINRPHLLQFSLQFSLWFLLPLILCFTNVTVIAQTGPYKYTDEKGVVHYVDHVSRIPKQYRDQIEALQLRKDPLSKSERALLKAKQEFQRQRIINSFTTDSFETRVKINGNQVLVPVTLGYRGREASAVLVLDTGATILFLNRQLRSRLGVRGLQKAEGQVAGGGTINIDVGTLDYVKLGPIKVNNIKAAFNARSVRSAFQNGLLGMNVLRYFEYSIDYEKQVVRWKLR